MQTVVALLKISGRTEHAYKRLGDLPLEWQGVRTKGVILGSGGYDAVVIFETPSLDLGLAYTNQHLRNNDPLTLIDVVTGASLAKYEDWTKPS